MLTSHNMLSLLEAKGMQANALALEAQQTFPPFNPTPTDDMNTIMYKAGQRSVVEWLIEKMENSDG